MLPETKIREYSEEESLIVKNRKLICKCCNLVLNHKNKFLSDQHVKTNKHVKRRDCMLIQGNAQEYSSVNNVKFRFSLRVCKRPT